MESFTVQDGEQPIRFVGSLLGRATTHDDHRPRWSETEIYRTKAGSYVIHKMGKTSVKGERTLHSTQISETAAGAVECLRFFDDDGVFTMRQIDRRALLAAIDEDDDLHAAYTAGITVA